MPEAVEAVVGAAGTLRPGETHKFLLPTAGEPVEAFVVNARAPGEHPELTSGRRRYSGSSPKCARMIRCFRYSSVPRSSTMSPPVS